jgi:hypothetical protein
MKRAELEVGMEVAYKWRRNTDHIYHGVVANVGSGHSPVMLNVTRTDGVVRSVEVTLANLVGEWNKAKAEYDLNEANKQIRQLKNTLARKEREESINRYKDIIERELTVPSYNISNGYSDSYITMRLTQDSFRKLGMLIQTVDSQITYIQRLNDRIEELKSKETASV